MAVTQEQAAKWAMATRQHMRAVHAEYVKGFDLDAMTPRELIENHDDMPAHLRSCWDFPSDYR
jgi:hypothetical protein